MTIIHLGLDLPICKKQKEALHYCRSAGQTVERAATGKQLDESRWGDARPSDSPPATVWILKGSLGASVQ